MTTGTLSGGVCFASQAAAARNECSLMIKAGSAGMTCWAIQSAPLETSGGSVVVTFLQRWQSANSASYSQVAYNNTLQACELEDYWPMPLTASSGALIAAAVASAWLTAWGWKKLRQAVD